MEPDSLSFLTLITKLQSQDSALKGNFTWCRKKSKITFSYILSMGQGHWLDTLQ